MEENMRDELFEALEIFEKELLKRFSREDFVYALLAYGCASLTREGRNHVATVLQEKDQNT